MERGNATVDVVTRRGAVRLPWASREALLGRLRTVSGAEPIVDAFEALGTSRPIDLDDASRDLLQTILDSWLTEVTAAGLPPAIMDLRDALIEDTHDRGSGA